MDLTLQSITTNKSVIEARRISQGMSVRQLASVIDVSMSTYTRKVEGKSLFNAHEIARLMSVFNLDFYDIFTPSGELKKEKGN